MNIDPDDYDRPEAWVGKTQTPVAVIPSSQKLRTGVFSVMNGQGPEVDGALDFQIVWGPSLVRSQNVTLVRNANVRRLDAPGAAIDRVQAQTIDRTGTGSKPGISFSVRAKQYVVAARGIETIRLLLLSKPGGLGNGAGLLGRNFMVHPLNVNAGYVSPTDETLVAENLGNFRALVNFNSGNINLNWEQIPNPDSRITLGPTRDMFGDPVVLLDWNTTASDDHTARTAIKLTVDELKRLGYATRAYLAALRGQLSTS